MMPEHKDIYTALLAAQENFTPAKKTKTNPHLKNQYAPLEEVLSAVQGPLADEGICIVSAILHEEGQPLALRTTLRHVTSDGSMSVDLPLLMGKQDMQGLGSAISYARRYGLMLLCGIVAEDDDDGHATQRQQAPNPQQQAEAKAAAMLTRVKAALDFDDSDFIREHVLSAPPAVRQALAHKLEPQHLETIKRMAQENK
jgi:hypothetical protein